MRQTWVVFLVLSLAVPALAQQPPAKPRPLQPFQKFTVPQSPAVQPDGSVTFRFRDPNAKKVMLAVEGASPVPMRKGADGVWTATVGPLAPEFYGYSYIADGVPTLDPFNPLIKPNLRMLENMVHVPGPPSLPWELNDVPHGVVRHILYHSAVVGDNRDFYVYTPPGYDPQSGVRYPVLYLLHGFSDDASAWTAVGRANIILDNLIAQGKVKPMVVVMPLGYGAPRIVARHSPGFHDPALVQENLEKFTESLLTEVMPRVEKDYRVLTDRDHTAITGLSMGGGESLYTGLNHLDKFAWVGAFSAGLGESNYASEFPSLDSSVNSKLRLLWIACGEQDPVVGAFNRKFRAWLDSKGVHYVNIQTPGMHTWMVWRANLAAFVPLLFR